MPWHHVCPSDALPPGGTVVVRDGATQVVVLRLDDGTVHALDNRCPHEGYPLAQGDLQGGVLTCRWHTYTFDVRSGACLKGDEDVARWPVRERDGAVEVDLTPPDPAAAVARIWPSLDAGLRDANTGRIARDVVRLLALGVSPSAIVAFGVAWDARHGEYGPTHGLPVLADVLPLAAQRGGVDAAGPLVLGLDVATERSLRRPPRPRPPPLAGDATALRHAVAREDAPAAEGIVRHLAAAGATPEDLGRAVLPVLADHFLDFGHGLIFATKLVTLARATPVDVDLTFGALVHGLANGTREDLLPTWAGWRARAGAVDPGALEGTTSLPRDALVDTDPKQAFSRLTSGVTLTSALAALREAAAERLWRFDVAIDSWQAVQDGWLDVTHRLTFVDAIGHAVPYLDPADRWRLVLQAGQFVATARVYDGDRAEPAPAPADPARLEHAWADRDEGAALGAAIALIAQGRRAEVEDAVLAWAMGDHAVRPIVVAHLLKTAVAAAAATDSDRPLLAVVRWFACPVQERRVNRLVHEARQLVVDGRPPAQVSRVTDRPPR
ncbi:MAG: Rieske (2Fe-2S) protein [Alphaproteobacteria bacterium]|nr:Rieske (2Fe-2S) protein [Alphaproteobacteria bacterium]